MLHIDKVSELKHDVVEVFRKHISEYRRAHRLSYEQAKAVQAILDCRTPALGGIVKMCPECKRLKFHYKACKNRHCPTCGAFEKAQWLENQKLWLLPIPYFHVVFTIDHVFNPLVAFNKRVLYNTLIRVASDLLKEFGLKYLGGEIGFSMVLHTWGQTMQDHLHLHFIVTGGALVSTSSTQGVSSTKGYRWQAASRKFLFPVKLLSKQFRNRFCFAIAELVSEGKVNTNGGKLDVGAMLATALSKNWEVYIQRPIYGAEKLLEYLGRYIFRIAISNHRIVAVEKGMVTFKYFDNRDEGKEKVMTLPAGEFIRRFLSHVLPYRFVRIRHFGLHHSSCRPKLQQARALLGLPFQLPIIAKLKLFDWLKKILDDDRDPRTCKFCGEGIMFTLREFGPVFGWRLKFHRSFERFSRWRNAFA